MKIVYGTGNQGKLESMRRALKSLNMEIIGLKELEAELSEPQETGNTPLENAGIKALAYYKAIKTPVFSCDSGLYFENLPDNLQPGIHVRNINGKRHTDEEMIAYYSKLAKKYGDLTGRYKNAICFIFDEEHIYESMDDSLSGDSFILTAKPHEKRVEGFPLDSLSIDIVSGMYYYDLMDAKADEIAVEGFPRFFEKVMRELKEEGITI